MLHYGECEKVKVNNSFTRATQKNSKALRGKAKVIVENTT